MSDVAPALLRPGDVFQGRYLVVRCIKAGGMGAVYEVLHREARRKLALKVMLPRLAADARMRARFRQEAMIAADVQSEHIVEVCDAGADPESGALFLVMSLLVGDELGALLRSRGRLPAEEAVVLLAQAARALDKLHAAGVVHRDLKPENLFVTYRDDGSPCLKVLDFGIAKVLADPAGDAGSTQTSGFGTPLYMAPEQVEGHADIGPRADGYALAHIAYELLAGEAYWKEEWKSLPAVFPLLGRIARGAAEPAVARAARHGVTLPAAFDGWFARATALAPEARFESCIELVGELAGALDVLRPPSETGPIPRALAVDAGVAADEVPTETLSSHVGPADTGRPRRRRRLLSIAIAAGGAVLVAGLAAGGGGKRDSSEPASAGMARAAAELRAFASATTPAAVPAAEAGARAAPIDGSAGSSAAQAPSTTTATPAGAATAAPRRPLTVQPRPAAAPAAPPASATAAGSAAPPRRGPLDDRK